MKRMIVQFAIDSDNSPWALAADGTLWVQGTRGWDKIEGLPDIENDAAPRAPAPVRWRPKGTPIWSVDPIDWSAVEVRSPAQFLRFANMSGAGQILVEAETAGEAVDAARVGNGPGNAIQVIEVDGGQFRVFTNVIPF